MDQPEITRVFISSGSHADTAGVCLRIDNMNAPRTASK